jgi:hypothetical protein
MLKKMMSMLFTLLFTCLAFLSLGEFGTFRVRLMLSSLNACLIIARVSVIIFSEICTKFDAHSLLDPSRNHVRPDM